MTAHRDGRAQAWVWIVPAALALLAACSESPREVEPPAAVAPAPERVKALAAAAGLTLRAEIPLLPTHAFPVFTKAE